MSFTHKAMVKEENRKALQNSMVRKRLIKNTDASGFLKFGQQYHVVLSCLLKAKKIKNLRRITVFND